MDSRGLLQIPKSASDHVITFTDKEFGTIHVPKANANHHQPTYVFAAPPSKNFKLKGDKVVRIEQKNSFPAFLVNSGNELALINAEIKPGQEVLARRVRLPGFKHDVYEVVVFNSSGGKITGMPKTGNEIKWDVKGYVLIEQLEPKTTEQTIFNIFKISLPHEKFVATNQDIFPNGNLINDVKQYRFGDCFLLSTILSILQKKDGVNDDVNEDGVSFIKNMMIQDGKYTTVRLYHPVTSKPVYIRVQNSIYYQDGKKQSQHGALWVHILEKAYTAFAMKMKEDDEQPTYSHPSFRDIYGGGGHSRIAFSILTGKPASDTKFAQTEMCDDLNESFVIYSKLNGIFTGLNKKTIKKIDKLKKSFEKMSEKNRAKLLAFSTKHKDEQNTEELNLSIEKFNQENPKAGKVLQILYKKKISICDIKTIIENYNLYIENDFLKEIFPKLSLAVNFGGYLYELMLKALRDDFFDSINKTKKTNFFEALKEFNAKENVQFTFPADVKESLQAIPIANLQQTLGSGEYSGEMLRIFSDITDELQTPSVCFTALTKPQFDSVVPGLRPKHVYTIIGTYEKEVNGKTLKFIQLRNPWRRVGREYKWDAQKNELVALENKDNPISEVELSDFNKYFCKITKGSFNIPPAPKPAPKSFLQHHWGKIAICALIVTAIVVASVLFLPLGLAGAITAGVMALGGGVLSATAATAIGIGTVAVGAACVGSGVGVGIGAVQDCCIPQMEKTDRLTSSDSDESKDTPSNTDEQESDYEDESSYEEESEEESEEENEEESEEENDMSDADDCSNKDDKTKKTETTTILIKQLNKKKKEGEEKKTKNNNIDGADENAIVTYPTLRRSGSCPSFYGYQNASNQVTQSPSNDLLRRSLKW